MTEQADDKLKISGFRLKLNLWIVTNKLILKKILIGFLIGLSVIFFTYSSVTAINILVFQKEAYQALLADLPVEKIDYQFFHESQKPSRLVISESKVLNSSGGRKDIIAILKNNNDNFIVRRLDYQFVSGNNIIGEGTVTVWPNDEVPLVVFGAEGLSDDQEVSLSIINTTWQRVRDRDDFNQFFNERFKFVFENIDFISAGFSKVQGKLPNSRVGFTVANNSIFDFWNVGFYVVLYNNDAVVGAHYVQVERFDSLETKNLEVAWFNPLPTVTRVEITPELDIFDENIYVDKGMVSGEEK